MPPGDRFARSLPSTRSGAPAEAVLRRDVMQGPAVGGWMTGRVLLVEPDPALRAALTDVLRGCGLAVEDTADGADALIQAPSGRFDVVIVDLTTPGLCGLEGCRRIRCESDVPILVISARGSELDRILGLEAGADDYIVKPISIPEVTSRVRAILRRRQLDLCPSRPQLRIGDLVIDLAAQRVRVGRREVRLTPMEFGMLALLAGEPGRTFTPQEILRQLWGSQHVGQHGACKTHIANLRLKLEEAPARPRRIVTVRGKGYLLRAYDEPPAADVVEVLRDPAEAAAVSRSAGTSAALSARL
jgi:DNA-binding response OmpR family regulator